MAADPGSHGRNASDEVCHKGLGVRRLIGGKVAADPGR